MGKLCAANKQGSEEQIVDWKRIVVQLREDNRDLPVYADSTADLMREGERH